MTNLRVLSSFTDKRNPLSYLLPGNHSEGIVYWKGTASDNFPFSKFWLCERSLVRGNLLLKIWNLNISQGFTIIQWLTNPLWGLVRSFVLARSFYHHQDACEIDLKYSKRELQSSIARSEECSSRRPGPFLFKYYFQYIYSNEILCVSYIIIEAVF